jgi:carboxymethylenebutenolidase
MASWLAAQGYVAIAPDYMTPVGVTPQTWESSFYVSHTDQIREDLGRGLDCLKSFPYVASDRIGVMGFSLGGYYSFVMGTREDVKAVVSWYGAIFGTPITGITRTPTRYWTSDMFAQMRASTLILHGDSDTEPPVANAIRARALLLSAGKEVELVVYPGVGHGWDCERCRDYVYHADVTADARARTHAFFQAKLK